MTPADRLRLVRQKLSAREETPDAALLSSLPDVRWASGFTGSNGLLLVRPSEAPARLVTDGRYQTQAAREVGEGVAVHIARGPLAAHVAEEGLIEAGERVLFQSDDVTVATLDTWREHLEEVDWRPASGLLRDDVARKDDEEIDTMRAAQRLTEDVFAHVTEGRWEGRTEREIAAEIVYEHLQGGAERMAFDPIVAGGPNGALPHARATGRRLEAGDLVIVDVGGVVDGYASDMTRVVSVGPPGAAEQEIYDLVRRAQEAALGAARAGMKSNALDAAARDVIEAAGHGDRFSHSLGHGVGLRTHEWPSVSYRHGYALPEGAAVTIEPGVYLPDRFGVRIEDTVVLREDGIENLTRAPKDIVVC